VLKNASNFNIFNTAYTFIAYSFIIFRVTALNNVNPVGSHCVL
jgi:hypothetical protein